MRCALLCSTIIVMLTASAALVGGEMVIFEDRFDGKLGMA